jgi:trehalose synthase-fused probable maltokinase
MNLTDPIPALPGPGDSSIFAPGEARATLERDVLPAVITRARWFGGKARDPRRFTIRDTIPLGDARLLLVEVTYPQGASDHYLLPLHLAAESAAPLARCADGRVLADALASDDFRAALYRLLATGGTVRGERGALTGLPGDALAGLPAAPASRALAAEQSNSSILYGGRVFLKLYRRLEAGVNPDAEILRFLAARGFPHVPPFCGALEYQPDGDPPRTLALATGLVPNDGDAWAFTQRHLAEFFASVRAGDSAGAEKLAAEYHAHAAQLGQRTGTLHRALAADSPDPDFAPDPLGAEDFAPLAAAIRASAQAVGTLLAGRPGVLDPATRTLAAKLAAHLPAILARTDALPRLTTRAAKTRTHGDYHLGQVLHGPGGFVIIDFEGEPMRPLAERRRKLSPFRDVAGMLRSFHYAAHAALEPLGAARAALGDSAESWAAQMQRAFLAAWLAATPGAVFRDPDPAAERALLDAFLLEKALYEIRYEVNNRPTWLAIPLRGVLALLEGDASSSP